MIKNCSTCSAEFEVTDTDLAFYDKVSPEFGGVKYAIPAPTHCPDCRYQRRLAFRNERNLYHRKCDLSGKPMIAMHPADSPFPVYHITEWMGDQWDPKDYGRDFDFNRPFFEQFKEFCNDVPHFSAFVDPSMDENSEYTNCSSEAKNCYLITQAERNEDCYYSRGINTCTNCCDCFRVQDCQLCYEVIDGNNCYNCMYCQDCDNCSDCYFSSDLRACKYCFGCHGLSNKEYCIFNEQVTPEEWKQKVEALTFTPEIVNSMIEKSTVTRLQTPQRATRLINCENSTGDHVKESRNSQFVFDSNGLEDCAYCNEVPSGAKDCYDYCMWGINAELLYECSGCGYNLNRLLFSNHCWQNCSDLLYCESCFPSVRDCFGCFGLRHAQYCIFNKQYTKEEYEVLVPRIIEHMKQTGEWGEFFPIEISFYGYNESLAQQFFPLTKEDAIAKGYPWYEQKQEKENYLGPDRVVPDNSEPLPDDITDTIFTCSVTGQPYRFTKQEIEFYAQLGLPLPTKCPQQRHKERFERRNPRKLWDRECGKCAKAVKSTFSSQKPEIIYCEDCYLSQIY